MPKFRITAPDGTTYDVTGPEGSTEQEALAQVQAQHPAQDQSQHVAQPQGVEMKTYTSTRPGRPITYQAPVNDTRSVLQHFKDTGRDVLAGGESALQIGTGVVALPISGLAGLAVGGDANTIRRTQQALTYQPRSEGGQTITGGVTAPLTAYDKGANWLGEKTAEKTGSPFLGSAAYTLASLVPALATGGESLARLPARNLATRSAEGAATREIAQVPQQAVAPSSGAVDLTAVNAERQKVFQEARAKGLVAPPTAINPSAVNTAAESLGGKAMVRQDVLAKNQPKINQLLAEDMGLPKNQPITRGSLRAVRQQFGSTKNEVKQQGAFKSDDQYLTDVTKLESIGSEVEGAYPGSKPKADPEIQKVLDSALVDTHDAASAVNYATILRERARANFQAARFKGGDSQLTALAKTQRGVADAIESLITRNLEANGKTELAKAWEEGRIKTAKSFDAEAALKGNDIVGSRLAKQYQKGKPMSGNFGLVARFVDQFEELGARPKSGVGVSKLGAVLGLGGAVAGHPGFMAIPVAGYAARKIMLGNRVQNALARSSVVRSRAPSKYNALRKGAAVTNALASQTGQR